MQFNKDRLGALITVMQRVVDNKKPFSINSWRSECTTEHPVQGHTCGTSACVGGYLAMSPEFIKAGGSADKEDGSPQFKGHDGFYALGEYLDCNEEECYEGVGLAEMIADPPESEEFYGVDYNWLTAEIVVARLAKLLETGH